MQLLCKISPPYPPLLNRSYGDFGYWNFGLGCWVYNPTGVQVFVPSFDLEFDLGSVDLYCGEIEWINTPTFISQPKYPNPHHFRYWFKPGVNYKIFAEASAKITIPDMTFNKTPFNMVTGKNMPLIPIIP